MQVEGQSMVKQKAADTIAELERQLAATRKENAKWEACYDEVNKERVEERRARLDDAQELDRLRRAQKAREADESRRQREAEREAERKRLDDLSNGVVDLSKIKHDLGFDYDHDVNGGTVTITLHASSREAKILNAYATRDRRQAPTAQSILDEMRLRYIGGGFIR